MTEVFLKQGFGVRNQASGMGTETEETGMEKGEILVEAGDNV